MCVLIMGRASLTDTLNIGVHEAITSYYHRQQIWNYAYKVYTLGLKLSAQWHMYEYNNIQKSIYKNDKKYVNKNIAYIESSTV